MKYDENKIFRDITLKVTGSLDMGTTLVDMRTYLQELMPLDEIILVRVEADGRGVHQVLRVTDKGLIGKPNQLLFIRDEYKDILDGDRFVFQDSQPAEEPTVLSAETIRDLEMDHVLAELGLPPFVDVLLMYNPALGAALVAVSYKEKVYNEEHLSLIKLLREPFYIALANALRYTDVQKKRDDLQDDNLLFREATVRLTGEHNIGKAFHETLKYLMKVVPLDEIMLIQMSEESDEQRMLLRVDETGVSGEQIDLIPMESLGVQKRVKILENLPDTFVSPVGADDYFSLNDKERVEIISKFGLSTDVSVIVIGVKAVQAGILFIARKDEQFSARHLEILKTLKEPFVIALHNALRFYELENLKNQLAEENRALQRDMQREVGDRVIGMHQGLKHVMTLASQVARTPSPVLLLGETGSGKEVVATAVHRISERAKGPFISLNCGAIPESLIDSELFGHERGAFTGANERKRGRFERADKGTLFLDEVGELPPSAQVKLLRVLQEKEFERVGGSHPVRTDVRLIAATNRDLPAMVRGGEFREDLWFRLNVFPIEIPPLRERREDIPALSYFFIETKRRQLNLPFRPTLPPDELERLMTYDWPGNVRELQNAIERALILSRGEPLRFPYLASVLAAHSDQPSPAAAPDTTPASIPTYKEAVMNYLRFVLQSTNGRIAGPKGAAKLAGLNPSTFRSKIKKLGVEMPRFANSQLDPAFLIAPPTSQNNRNTLANYRVDAKYNTQKREI